MTKRYSVAVRVNPEFESVEVESAREDLTVQGWVRLALYAKGYKEEEVKLILGSGLFDFAGVHEGDDQ